MLLVLVAVYCHRYFAGLFHYIYLLCEEVFGVSRYLIGFGPHLFFHFRRTGVGLALFVQVALTW